ncbi:FecR family protein [Citromicrobium bathyomarinum]|uniref:FecR family protein n=1 Tax=Citromicrobium bathyomarinum TaxID=72174 RepID=UPI001E575551|nr:FecR domain-containing protein [Citromicrobium bathyomarinum]MCD1621593.1 FecR domain-containing protein [Citromicrobium bathyomarinum]
MSAAEIEDIAAGWLIRREEPGWTDQDEAEFAAWMDRSMAHKAAYWRLEHGWREADRIPALGDTPSCVEEEEASGPRRTVFALVGALAASLVLALTGIAMWSPPVPTEPPARYETARGAREAVKLADGSTVELNTATRLRAASGPDAREVWLDEGEAFFDIVHRPDRRFIVHAGPRRIVVLGTRFSVKRSGDDVTVAVVSGRVKVEDSASAESAGAAIVSTGDVAYIRKQNTLVVGSNGDEVNAMTAWREGLLVFDNTPLRTAVAEFNRYSGKPIQVAPDIQQIRIGGSFQTHNADAFLDLLQSAYGLHVERHEDMIELKR